MFYNVIKARAFWKAVENATLRPSIIYEEFNRLS